MKNEPAIFKPVNSWKERRKGRKPYGGAQGGPQRPENVVDPTRQPGPAPAPRRLRPPPTRVAPRASPHTFLPCCPSPENVLSHPRHAGFVQRHHRLPKENPRWALCTGGTAPGPLQLPCATTGNAHLPHHSNRCGLRRGPRLAHVGHCCSGMRLRLSVGLAT